MFFNKSKILINKVSKKILLINKEYDVFKNYSEEQFLEFGNQLKSKYLNKNEIEEVDKIKAIAAIKALIKIEYSIELFDIQLIAGYLLNNNIIAEMKTGEGKTFTSIIPIFLQSILNNKNEIDQKVFVCTANEYLANRDFQITNKILSKLGITVGCINTEPKKNYKKNVVYSTINRFAFDYLKDNTVLKKENIMQKSHNFILLDEADLTLIDYARTPLSLTNDSVNEEIKALFFMKNFENDFNENDYLVDIEFNTISFNESFYNKLEHILIENKIIEKTNELYSVGNLKYLHALSNIIKAKELYRNNINYIVKDEQINIIDEKTGRISEGRRYGNGIQQAIELKENVPVQESKSIIGNITVQNYLKNFKKISGMTGTAETDKKEYKSNYGLDVIVFPTNKKSQRKDYQDIVFFKKEDKYKAIVKEIKEEHEKGRPILIGTTSIESSMELSSLLMKNNLKHELLNAKNHEKESKIISKAGEKFAITIATNMAGRGTDIMLGGDRDMVIEELMQKGLNKEDSLLKWKELNQEINDLGGLHIIGSERSESRRIDNQLIGRSGRQGDNGSTQFYLSLEDEMVKKFGLQKIEKLWKALGVSENEGVYNVTLDMNISLIQKKIEASNYEARKMVNAFDDLKNEQRRIIYDLRNKIINKEESIYDFIVNFTESKLIKLINQYANESYNEENWNLKELDKSLEKILGKNIEIEKWFKSSNSYVYFDLKEKIISEFKQILNNKKEILSDYYLKKEKEIVLRIINEEWASHLSSIEQVKNRVFYKRFAQQKPLEEYQKEIYREFLATIDNIAENIIINLCHIEKFNYEKLIKENRTYLSPIFGTGF